jgi:hypothetical protein
MSAHLVDIRAKSASVVKPGQTTRENLSSEEIAQPHAKFIKTDHGVRHGSWIDPKLNQPYFNVETDVAF